jgi:hypothetical protein
MVTKTQGRPFKTAFCSKYEEMLGECQLALGAWAKRREEAWQLGLSGRELGAELMRLQADFAKSYARLQKHTRECVLCEFQSKMISNEVSTLRPYEAKSSQETRPA